MTRNLALSLALSLAPALALAQESPAPSPSSNSAAAPPVPSQLTVATSPAPSQTPAATPPQAPPPRERQSSPPVAAWPVRAHLSMPLGSTFGNDHVQGFTWGFRAELQAYPTSGFRGIGAGGFIEMLLDAETRQFHSYGALVSGPVVSFSWGGLRLGGFAGARYRGDADPRGAMLLLGAQFGLALPAYLYDLGIGLRLDASIDETGLVASSLLVDVDLAVLVVMLGAAGFR